MRRGTIAALALALVAVAAGGQALAHGAAKTTLVFDYTGPFAGGSSKTFAVGHLVSPDDKCLAKRKVKVGFLYENEDKPVTDVDYSSKKGGFSGVGPNLHHGNQLDAIGMQVKKTADCKGDFTVVG